MMPKVKKDLKSLTKLKTFKIIMKNCRLDPVQNLLIGRNQKEGKKRPKLCTLWLSSVCLSVCLSVSLSLSLSLSLIVELWNELLNWNILFINFLLIQEILKKRKEKRMKKEKLRPVNAKNQIPQFLFDPCLASSIALKLTWVNLFIFCFFLHFYFDVWINSYIIFITIFTNTSVRAGYDTRSIIKRS